MGGLCGGGGGWWELAREVCPYARHEQSRCRKLHTSCRIEATSASPSPFANPPELPKVSSIATSRAGKNKGSPCGDPLKFWIWLRLQSGFDFEAPSFEQRFRDVLRVLVPTCPLAQARGAQVLVRGELVLAHDLFELGDGRDDGPDRLGLTPVGISATLCHETCLSYNRG